MKTLKQTKNMRQKNPSFCNTFTSGFGFELDAHKVLALRSNHCIKYTKFYLKMNCNPNGDTNNHSLISNNRKTNKQICLLHHQCSLCRPGLINDRNEVREQIYFLNLMSRETILSFDPSGPLGEFTVVPLINVAATVLTSWSTCVTLWVPLTNSSSTSPTQH